jgi:sulfate/thiosulfate transport system permease protein
VRRSPTEEPRWLERALIGTAIAFVVAVIVLPVGAVIGVAFSDGLAAYGEAVSTHETLAAIRLSALTMSIVVPINVTLGVALAWALGRFRFRGRGLLITLLDVPLAVSPVIAGMAFVLLFGRRGALGSFLADLGLEIIFSTPGIVLATLFVTFPFVARELIPFWEAQGVEEEEAALVLGASAWTTFWRVSLPNARWALLYGVVLTVARSLGEFGAVSVVSGHIRGATNTVPLHVEVLYGDYRFSAAFAVASLLVGTGLVTLLIKRRLERKLHQTLEPEDGEPT